MKLIEFGTLFSSSAHLRNVAILIALLSLVALPGWQQPACGWGATCFGDGDDDDDESRFQTVSRLTLSFAPDGTNISRYTSTLFSSFDAVVSDDEIRQAVIDAFQIWSQYAAINVGLVDDSGDDFGSAGQSQNDPRFGDIRIGAVPMAGDVYAVAVPSNELVSGTWSGDLLFNSNAKFVSAEQFFAVALHEAGHVLGLGHSDDATSVMHPTALNTEPSAIDIAEIKLLYGERLELDPHEDDPGENDHHDDAVEIEHEIDEGSFGSVPLLVFGDIDGFTDVDFFRFETDSNNDNYSGPISFRLISNQVSCLQPRFTLFRLDVSNGDETLVELASATSSDSTGSDLIIDEIVVEENQKYFLKVESAGTELTNFGSYAIVVETNPGPFDDLIQVAIRRNYSEVDEDDLQNLFLNNLEHDISDDGHTNDTIQTASELLPPLNIALHSAYREQASIADQTDIDYYFFAAQDVVMTVRVSSDFSGLIPAVSAFDNQFEMLSGEFMVNGNGELLMEFAGLIPGDIYYVSVAANEPEGPFGTGNYDLNIAFRDSPRQLDRLAPKRRAFFWRGSSVHSLYVARSQLFHFAFENLDPALLGSAPEPTFWISIYGENGELKYRCATKAGALRTARSVILTPGSYSVHIDTTRAEPNPGPGGGKSAGYLVWGIGVSEPTGPELIDPADDPFAPCDKSGSDFCYPNDRISSDEFIFVDPDEVDIPPVDGPLWLDADVWYWSNDWTG